MVDGFGACLMVSVLFAGLSCVIDLFLHEDPGAAGSRRLGVLGACMPGRRRMPAEPEGQGAAAAAADDAAAKASS